MIHYSIHYLVHYLIENLIDYSIKYSIDCLINYLINDFMYYCLHYFIHYFIHYLIQIIWRRGAFWRDISSDPETKRMVQKSNSNQSEKSCWLFSQWNGWLACRERLPLQCCSNIPRAQQIWLTPIFVLNLHSGLRWLKINFSSPVIKFPINRFYDRLCLWTSY